MSEFSEAEASMLMDVHHLTALDPRPLEPRDGASASEAEEKLRLRAELSTQCLVNRLFSLEAEKTLDGVIVTLPRAVLKLPRALPPPVPKEPTRWEKFAKEKGIMGQTRDRMVWDEATETWKPRYGYKRTGSEMEEAPILEVKTGQDIYADPWAAKKEAKQVNVAKNERNQRKNAERNGTARPGTDINKLAGVPVDLRSEAAAAAAEESGGKAAPRKRGMEGTAAALRMVQKSTASLGQHDEMRAGEGKRELNKGKRRQFAPNVAGGDGGGGMRELGILEKVLLAPERKAAAREHARSAAGGVHDTHDGLAPHGEGERKGKKGRAGMGKLRKMTKKRAKTA